MKINTLKYKFLLIVLVQIQKLDRTFCWKSVGVQNPTMPAEMNLTSNKIISLSLYNNLQLIPENPTSDDLSWIYAPVNTDLFSKKIYFKQPDRKRKAE